MSKKNEVKASDTNLSYLTLRKTLGILGLALPFVLIIVNGFDVKSSISHFYYSDSTVIFTGFMFAFGFFLMTYKGRTNDDVVLSDSFITSIAGFAAIATAIIPTMYKRYDTNITAKIEGLRNDGSITTQYMHNNEFIGNIHFACAGIFLILMGYMIFQRFTKPSIMINETTGERTIIEMKKQKKLFYKICGIMVWLPIIFLGINMSPLKLTDWNYTVLVCEWISLSAFGFAWMVKGKAFEKMNEE